MNVISSPPNLSIIHIFILILVRSHVFNLVFYPSIDKIKDALSKCLDTKLHISDWVHLSALFNRTNIIYNLIYTSSTI